VLVFCAGLPHPLLYRVDSEQVVEMKSRGAQTSILAGPVLGKEQAQVVDVKHNQGFVYAALEQQRDGQTVVSLWNYASSPESQPAAANPQPSSA